MNVKTELSHLELEILEDILNAKIEGKKAHPRAYPEVAYIVWIEDGKIEFGPCRWGYRSNYITDTGNYASWSVSPFPGAWTMVPITRIVRVRRINAI